MKHRAILCTLLTSLLLTACNSDNNPNSTMLSEEAAKKIALQEVPGATTEHIKLFKLDTNDDIRTYEGTIIYENNKYDFEIDTNDGTILEWDMEPVYD